MEVLLALHLAKSRDSSKEQRERNVRKTGAKII
jgi:hypothetical protein